MTTAFEKMDRMYRYQRYFYDLTRKYYLLGRDRLINEMKISDGENVLEIGCGTGRNLIILAKKYPEANFFGLDASKDMIKTAQKKIEINGLENIKLQTSLADIFRFDETFFLDNKFDVIFFSYSISMIPVWKQSIINALENLKSGKHLYFVDFYDQGDLPDWFRKLLTFWLSKFGVEYRQELIPYLEGLRNKKVENFILKPLYRGYSFIGDLKKI